MNRNVLLVHSPLVGPSIWRPMVSHLTALGFDATCPDLTGTVTGATSLGGESPGTAMHDFVHGAASSAVGDRLVVVGFSGAGAMMPNITAALGSRVATTVFVDALVPPAHGHAEPSAPFVDFIDARTVDGFLEPWIEWWPDQVPTLLPDLALRTEVASDMPRLPRSFYDESMDVPTGWVEGPNCYLRTSAAYDTDLARAASYGWPTGSIDGTHLSIVTEPAAVWSAVDRLLG